MKKLNINPMAATMSDARRSRLETILNRETEKSLLQNKVLKPTSAETARYRNLMLSVDSAALALGTGAAPPPSVAVARAASGLYAGRPTQSARHGATAAGATAGGGTRGSLSSSARATKAMPAHVNEIMKLQARAASEWATLTQFELDMFRHDKAAVAVSLAAQKAEQRAFLDGQRAEHDRQRQAALAERAADAERIAADVSRYADEEKAKAEARSARMRHVKADREAQVQSLLAERALARALAAEEDARDIAEIRARIDAERDALAAKKAAERSSMAATLRENDARIAAKREAAAADKADSERMIAEYQAMLLKQEKGREEALLALYSRSALMAAKAGESVQAAAAAKASADAARSLAYQKQKNEEAEAKEAASKLKKAADMADLKAVLARQTAERVRQKERAAAEVGAYMREVKARDAAESETEAATAAARRRAALATRRVLEAQMAEREYGTLLEDDMSGRERSINQPLLIQATRMGAM